MLEHELDFSLNCIYERDLKCSVNHNIADCLIHGLSGDPIKLMLEAWNESLGN